VSFELYPEEVSNRMALMPTVRAPEPGVFDNFLAGTGKVAMSGLAKAGRAVDLLGSVGAIAEDKLAGTIPERFGGYKGTVAQDRYFKEHDDVFNKAVDYWTPKPGEVGTAAQVVGALVGTLPLVFASPALAVGATQLGVGEDLVRQGVDASKAGAVGAVQGAGLGLGIWMPILGQNGWQRIVLGGAGFNVAQGVVTRGTSGAILSGTAAADEYKAFDGTQITLDVLLGAAFGGIAHLSPSQRAQGKAVWDKIGEWGKGLKPSDVDALATLRIAQNLNESGIPGKPLAPADADAWVTRTRTAIDQLTRDEPVNVTDMPEPKVALDPERIKAAEKITAEFDRMAAEKPLETPVQVDDARAGETQPPKPAEGEQNAGDAAKPPDPLSVEASRVADENPDLQIHVGTNEAGEKLTMTAREFLDHGDDIVKQAQADSKLYEIAAACMLGAG